MTFAPTSGLIPEDAGEEVRAGPSVRSAALSRSNVPVRRSERRESRARQGGEMSRVRLLVGTRKGAFVLTSDGSRDGWDVNGPLFAGWEIYHDNASPADPDRLYASQSSGWFGQIIQRSDDGGQTWETAGNECADDGGETWRPINRGLRSAELPDEDREVGHCVHRIAMHPSRPDVLFMQKHWDVMRSDDGGEAWYEVSDNLPSDFGFPIAVHAHEPDTVYVVPIKSDSEHVPPEGKLRVYRSRTGGNEWEPLTKGLPQQHCYVNVLRDTMAVDGLDPGGVYFGTTGGQIYASPDGGDRWTAIVRDLPLVLSVEAQTLP